MLAESFRLVKPAAEHAEGLDRLLNDPQVARALGGPRSRDAILETIDAEARHWREHGFGPWVALDRATGAVIGRGGIRRAQVLGRTEVELFYAVAPVYWGRGIARGIGAAALELGLARAGLPDLVAFTTEGNLASRRVIERLGLAREGTFTHAGLPHILYRVSRGGYLAR